MQEMTSIASEKNSTIVFPLPLSMLKVNQKISMLKVRNKKISMLKVNQNISMLKVRNKRAKENTIVGLSLC